jgi:hypothetical protein
MESYPNAKTSSDPVKQQRNNDPLPTKNKKRRHSTHVEEAEEDRCVPIYLAIQFRLELILHYHSKST